jgi:tRNA A37 threonylcarbamoyladenosine synthetase subunit TsaC/SUA5/YrdC
LNRSGAPPARTRAEAAQACGRGADAVSLLDVEGAEAGGVTASTVLDVTAARPRVLRLGAIPSGELEPALAELAAP